MKSFKNNLLAILSLGLILTASCKKYPEGPLLSLSSKISRVDGTWETEYFSINGYDSTSYLKSKPFYGFYEFSAKKDGLHLFAGYTALSYTKFGYWEFSDHKNDIHIHFDPFSSSPTSNLGAFGANDVTWEIRRLTRTDMWLKTTYEGREFYVKFKLFTT